MAARMTSPMAEPHPEDADHLSVVGHLAELRKRILLYLSTLAVFVVLAFSRGHDLIRIARRPAQGLIEQLIFISPGEAFSAYIKTAVLSGFILSFPFMLYHLWAFVSPAVEREKHKTVILWISMALVFFVGGLLFSYYVALPAALKFLIGFGENIAAANITVNKYISFFGMLMMAGGAVFEIPIIIGLLADIGLVTPAVLKKNRRFAILIILIVAAVITPTQDVINLLIFSLPMMLLYELGIVIASCLEKRRRRG
ncbi:MAG: twin-arginine translocase subunit TatC [Candidatus Omnitrophota bacterium]